MARRGSGEGSIYQRPDGTWVAQVSLGRDAAGKRIRKTIYGASKPEVLQKLKDYKPDALEPSKLTTGELLHKWLHEVVKPNNKPNTFANYEATVRRYVDRELQMVPLAKLSPLHIQSLLTRLGGRSARVRQLTFAVLRIALGQAVRWRLLSFNPIEGVDAPRYKAPKQEVWTEAQVSAFFASLGEDDWLRPLIYLDVATGLRHGELLGLRWTDLDLNARKLTVRGTLIEQKGRILGLATTKTDGDRVVTLPESVITELRRHQRELMAQGLTGAEWVFPNRKKGPRLQSTIRRAFYRAAQKAGLPVIRVHDLRHTMATLLLKSGANVKVVQERLGHSQVQVTLNTYAHVLPSMQDEAAVQIDNLLTGRK